MYFVLYRSDTVPPWKTLYDRYFVNTTEELPYFPLFVFLLNGALLAQKNSAYVLYTELLSSNSQVTVFFSFNK